MPEASTVQIEKLSHGYLIILKDGIENRIAITEEEIRALKHLLNEMKL